MRVCFVNENIGGHGTLHRHLRIALGAHEDVTARFVDVHPAGKVHRALRAPVPGLARFDLDASGFRDHLVGAQVARRRMGALAPGEVLHLYTQSIGSALIGTLRRHPSVVGTDATLLQSARLLPFREPTRFTDRVNGLERRVERRVLDAATLVVAQSQWCADSLTGDYGIDADRVRIVPYGILMDPRPDVAVADPPVITWTGRSLERKGGARLLRIWRAHLRDRSRLRLITPVPVDPEPGLEVINDLTRDDTARRDRLLAESSVFVFPSDMDTFGYAPIEAMAMGTPVVAYRATALPETVRDGETGLLVEPGDDDELRRAIERLLDDAALRTRLGAAAQEDARARFDARVTTAALVDVLREAAARHG
jgi:glycosyltransferase involved in cell wall biosynthesis